MKPGGIVPVAPEAFVLHGGQVDTGSALQFSPAVGAAAGVIVHEIHGIIGAETVDAGLGHQIFGVILIGLAEFRISMAEALGGVLGEPQGLSGLYIQHTPVV